MVFRILLWGLPIISILTGICLGVVPVSLIFLYALWEVCGRCLNISSNMQLKDIAPQFQTVYSFFGLIALPLASANLQYHDYYLSRNLYSLSYICSIQFCLLSVSKESTIMVYKMLRMNCVMTILGWSIGGNIIQSFLTSFIHFYFVHFLSGPAGPGAWASFSENCIVTSILTIGGSYGLVPTFLILRVGHAEAIISFLMFFTCIWIACWGKLGPAIDGETQQSEFFNLFLNNTQKTKNFDVKKGHIIIPEHQQNSLSSTSSNSDVECLSANGKQKPKRSMKLYISNNLSKTFQNQMNQPSQSSSTSVIPSASEAASFLTIFFDMTDLTNTSKLDMEDLASNSPTITSKADFKENNTLKRKSLSSKLKNFLFFLPKFNSDKKKKSNKDLESEDTQKAKVASCDLPIWPYPSLLDCFASPPPIALKPSSTSMSSQSVRDSLSILTANGFQLQSFYSFGFNWVFQSGFTLNNNNKSGNANNNGVLNKNFEDTKLVDKDVVCLPPGVSPVNSPWLSLHDVLHQKIISMSNKFYVHAQTRQRYLLLLVSLLLSSIIFCVTIPPSKVALISWLPRLTLGPLANFWKLLYPVIPNEEIPLLPWLIIYEILQKRLLTTIWFASVCFVCIQVSLSVVKISEYYELLIDKDAVNIKPSPSFNFFERLFVNHVIFQKPAWIHGPQESRRRILSSFKDIRRKIFHFAMVLIILPAIISGGLNDAAYLSADYIKNNPSSDRFGLAMFTSLALGCMSIVFVLIEGTRLVMPTGLKSQITSSLFSVFIDARDECGVISTHTYLLIGCALPFWMATLCAQSYGHFDVGLSSLGVILLGIGDALASLVGRYCGLHKWRKVFEGILTTPALSTIMLLFNIQIVDGSSVVKNTNNSSEAKHDALSDTRVILKIMGDQGKRSVEGSLAFFLSSFIFSILIFYFSTENNEGIYFGSPTCISMIAMLAALVVGTVIEAADRGADNLHLPVMCITVYLSILTILGSQNVVVTDTSKLSNSFSFFDTLGSVTSSTLSSLLESPLGFISKGLWGNWGDVKLSVSAGGITQSFKI